MTKGIWLAIFWFNEDQRNFVTMTESPQEIPGGEVNLGIYDGEVSHQDVNHAINAADRIILLGEQPRLPYFPEDVRLRKLQAGDPLVLFVWKALKKIPATLRNAIIDEPISLTLIRGDELLYFRDVRCHQALHIGRRRHTIYLPQLLLHAAEEKGYDHWAIAEGLIYGAWMLLDYLLLANVLKAYNEIAKDNPSCRLTEQMFLRLVEEHNVHRREHVDEGRSEVREFVDGYKSRIIRIEPAEATEADPINLAHEFYDNGIEQRWARDKMERIAKLFNYPRMFQFDRDIIHGAARELAVRRDLNVAPETFYDLLHDYRDSRRFEPDPLMTSFGKGVVPKPRAMFLEQLVQFGAMGLQGFFKAYGSADPEVVELMHPLWMYLCSLSSDPAGVFSRVGRCRGIGRSGLGNGMDGPLAGILIRLDKASNYSEMVSEVGSMGVEARSELNALIKNQTLSEEDDWEVFKVRKQTIVTRAIEVLEAIDGPVVVGNRPRPQPSPLRGVALIEEILADNPHRLTSDPSGVLVHLRSYQKSVRKFGPEDPDSDFLLACLLLRLDRSEHHTYLLELVRELGILAFSALHNVFESIPEHDVSRHGILMPARRLWTQMLEEMRRSKKLLRSKRTAHEAS